MNATDQTTATMVRAAESGCPRSTGLAPKIAAPNVGAPKTGASSMGAPSTAAPGMDFSLRRASEVDAENAPDSALGSTVNWIREFLARPHRDVGRAGPVCPFTPMALELDTIWLAEIAEPEPDPQRIQDVVEQCRQVFLETEPREGAMAINKVFMVVFSSLDASDAPMIDAIQTRMKPNFVDVGMMLGEFHANNDTPGLRNPDFRPLRSPIPMLVMRHMVESDLPFLKRELDTPQVRSAYLRSYLRRLSGTIRRNYFEQALEALVQAEIELRANSAPEAMR